MKDVPGPGSYDVKERPLTARVGKFGNSQRDTIRQIAPNTEQMPGPGAYNDKGGLAHQASKRQNMSVQNLNVPATRAMSTLNKEQLQSPGPGNYNPAPIVVKAKTPAINFGSEKRPNHLVSKHNEAPGPGNYNNGGDFGKGVPTAKIGIRYDGPKRLDVPGPGAYDSKEAVIKPASSQSVRFNNSKRGDIVKREDLEKPGPGNYNQGSTLKGDKGFSLGGKAKAKYNENPGPGAYDARNDLTKAATGSMRVPTAKRKTFMQEAPTEMPGPGNYDQGSAFKGDKGFSIGAKQAAKYNENPGPGAYDARNDLTKAATGSMRVPTAKRKTFMEEAPTEMPGPGNYDQGSAFKADKGFTLGGKQPQKYNENPGPGAYEARNEVIKASQPSMRLASAKRTTFMENAPNDLPGPGNYD